MLRMSRDLTIDENDIEMSSSVPPVPAGRTSTRSRPRPSCASIRTRLRCRRRRKRLARLAGSRMTKDGVIVIQAYRFRTQERNRADAIERLFEMLKEAMVRPTPRRPTKPTFGSKQRRLEGKKRRSDIKAGRGRTFDD